MYEKAHRDTSSAFPAPPPPPPFVPADDSILFKRPTEELIPPAQRNEERRERQGSLTIWKHAHGTERSLREKPRPGRDLVLLWIRHTQPLPEATCGSRLITGEPSDLRAKGVLVGHPRSSSHHETIASPRFLPNLDERLQSIHHDKRPDQTRRLLCEQQVTDKKFSFHEEGFVTWRGLLSSHGVL
ncbi:hypothetical protein M406DRAFT_73749 [Cryphonectria parasitica EP155]|uniref:Uncharacterized protein n=1 Tax=Cryphonectria parasitica (strain ATCC 38755 / EP155) TaxID=660469 RepID=A0A9P4XYX6_CRYP1|nr:uncharacterized protein M406DRAFT_73749 [Cryphonectria parasitica EP155]KAF3763095.1 hypothetical protein M406DRAFT_73749 [Cryphonectria parasitica EP155]